MRRHPILLALGAGLVSATGFAPLALWPATLATLALLIALIDGAPSRRRALAIGYWFGVGHFTVGLNWIAHAFTFQEKMPHWFGYGAVIALSLYLAVYPAMAAGLAWRYGRGSRIVLPLVFAAAWIVTEWLRATMFTGFAWNPLGVVALPIAGLAQTSVWIGTYGVSGIVICLAGAAWLASRRQWRKSAAIVAPILLLAALLFPFLPPATAPSIAQPLIRVVQPNIPQEEKEGEAFDRVNFMKLARLTGASGIAPRLILWPEAAIPDYLELQPYARLRYARLLRPNDMLLAGGVALIGDSGGSVIGARNSLFALAPDGRLMGRYDKAHLVPYGEYLPMRPILSAIGFSRLVPGDLDFWAGPGPRTIALPGFGKLGVQICYEIIFSGDVVDPRNRPAFLFNPSNDAWFGAWGPPQHLAQARMRAIEEAMPIVRSTPTGISAIIDSRGRLLKSLPHGTAGFIETPLPPPAMLTLFAWGGNILSFLFALFLASIAIVIGRRAR